MHVIIPQPVNKPFKLHSLSAIHPKATSGHWQAEITTKKRPRSRRIFSVHISTNAIEIKFSAPLDKSTWLDSRGDTVM